MGDIFQRVWENLLGRVTGPMNFRLVLQPLVAIFFATRAGIRDAREGRPAFLWTALTDKSQRRNLLRSAWGHIGKVFIVACIIDAVYQLLEHRGVYILEMFIVATVLAVLPYIIIRGPVSRLVKLLYHPHKQNAQGEQHVK
jgi:hypothetical protein